MTDLVSDLSWDEQLVARTRLSSTSPDAGKYRVGRLEHYLSAEAEWLKCAEIQSVLLETRMEWGQATEENLKEVGYAMERFDPLNASMLEGKLK